MVESSPNGKKTLWVKEKLLFTSIFSFTYSVLKRIVLQTRKNKDLFKKGLNSVHELFIFKILFFAIDWNF